MLQVFSMPCGFLQFDNKLFFPNLEKGELFTVPVPRMEIMRSFGACCSGAAVQCPCRSRRRSHIQRRACDSWPAK